jgi:acetyltransferase-like isoleucine patch superfamily enzyme
MTPPTVTAGAASTLRIRGIQLPASLFAPTTTIHPATTAEAPCLVQGAVDWATHLEIGAFSVFYGGRLAEASIGRYCSIAGDASIGGAEHPTDRLTSSIVGFNPRYHGWDQVVDPDGQRSSRWTTAGFKSRPRTTIGNDVWLGADVLLRAGVTIGDGAIVAARSVVLDDVPPYAVVAGTPAKVKRLRFPEHTVTRLLALRWWRFSIYDLAGIRFDRVDECLPVLEERTAELREYDTAPVVLAAVVGR